ncbi:hypothetical protein ABT112_33740, partial [Streptomyces sp. NPDC002055]
CGRFVRQLPKRFDLHSCTTGGLLRRTRRTGLGAPAGQDALAGISELANIAAATGADEVVLAWETHDVATAGELLASLARASAWCSPPATGTSCTVPLQRAAPVPQSRRRRGRR